MELLNEFLKQLGVVQQAWIPFVVALAIVGFVIWKAVQREFSTRLANAQSTNDMLRERLDRAETSDAIAIASASQQMEATEADPPEPSPQPAISGTPRHVPMTQKSYVRDGLGADELIGMFDGRTELQAKAMLKDEIGKWIIVRGPVRGVSVLPSGSVIVAVKGEKGGLTFCRFPSVTTQLERLSENDLIEVEGQIADLSTIGLSLEKCTIISTVRASG